VKGKARLGYLVHKKTATAVAVTSVGPSHQALFFFAYFEPMPGKEKAGSKKAKDPNAPKRPLTAFFHFLAAKREAYVKDHPANKLGDVAKGLSEVWRGLSEAQKKPFEDLAAASKKTYEREMAHYTPAPRDPEDEDDDGKPAKKKAKKEKDPDAPKRALSAYMLFSIAEGPRIRSAHTGDPKEMMSKIAEEWKNADKATKDKYEKKAAEDKKRFTKESAAYKPSGGKAKAADGEADEEDFEE
jgi:hypothetical protein